MTSTVDQASDKNSGSVNDASSHNVTENGKIVESKEADVKLPALDDKKPILEGPLLDEILAVLKSPNATNNGERIVHIDESETSVTSMNPTSTQNAETNISSNFNETITNFSEKIVLQSLAQQMDNKGNSPTSGTTGSYSIVVESMKLEAYSEGAISSSSKTFGAAVKETAGDASEQSVGVVNQDGVENQKESDISTLHGTIVTNSEETLHESSVAGSSTNINSSNPVSASHVIVVNNASTSNVSYGSANSASLNSLQQDRKRPNSFSGPEGNSLRANSRSQIARTSVNATSPLAFAVVSSSSASSENNPNHSGKGEKSVRRSTFSVPPSRQQLSPTSIQSSAFDSAQIQVPNGSQATSPSTATMKKSSSLRRRKKDDDADSEDEVVIVGTKVDKDHVNYSQMYDMLTGIRVSVSRCEAKPARPITPEDFSAAHKLAFDITGNELTPSSKYDFKFKDYAPWVFRDIRKHFRIDPAEYLISLTGKYVLSELGSPGKSGSFFYFSRDYRFIIKTIHHTEHLFLIKILQQYYEHITKYPDTLISRFFGLHRVKLPGRKKIHFVVMGNIFPSNKDIHVVYDLKGSTVGRMLKQEEILNNPRAVQKDLNWLQQKMRMKLGPAKKKPFMEQIRKDCQFLAACGIMDYSLLLAIHYYSRGNSENIRDKSLSVFEPKAEHKDGATGKKRLSMVRKAIVESDPVALGPSNSYLPEELPSERKFCIFYQDEGGYRGTDENNQPVDELYYAGVIDILTPYNYIKRAEHIFKSINHEKNLISSVNPRDYCDRFIKFMEHSVLFIEPEERSK